MPAERPSDYRVAVLSKYCVDKGLCSWCLNAKVHPCAQAARKHTSAEDIGCAQFFPSC